MNGQVERIQLEGIRTQAFNRRPPVDAPLRCEAEAQSQRVETHVMLRQERICRIVPTCLDIHACRWKRAPQGGMIQLAVFYLFHQDFGKPVALFHQVIDGASGTYPEVHVAGFHLHSYRVASHFGFQVECHRLCEWSGYQSQLMQPDVGYVHS